MRRGAEFIAFGALAAFMHVLIAWLVTGQTIVIAAGEAGAAGGSLGAAGELSELIESWEAEPQMEDAAEQSEPETTEDEIDQPQEMAAVDPTTVDDQRTPEPLEQQPATTPPTQAQPSPERPLDQMQPVELETTTPVMQPVLDQPTPARPIEQAPAPESPIAPTPDTRVAEPEPDPNQITVDLAKLAPVEGAPALPIAPEQQETPPETTQPVVPEREEPETAVDDAPLVPKPEPEDAPQPDETRPLTETRPDPALDRTPEPQTDPGVRTQIAALPTQPTPAQPQPEAFQIPREVVPEDTGPAPRVAALPRQRPEVPEWARQKPKPQQVRREQPREQRREKKPEKKTQPRQQETTTPATAKPAATQKPATGSRSSGDTQTAARPGNGGTTTQGSGFSSSQIKAAQNKFVAAVRRAIMKKRRYPRRAERRGIAGRPVIRLTLDASGNLLGVTLASSSGSDLLDQAALKAVKTARYPRIPAEMNRSKVTLKYGISFEPG